MNISEISAGDLVHGVFLVADVDVRETRNGNPYLRMTLRDREGDRIDGLFFGVSERDISAVSSGKPFEVDGEADEYRNRVNVKINSMRVSEEVWDAEAYLPQSTQDPEILLAATSEAVDSISSSDIRNVMQTVLSDPEVISRLTRWPAAKTRHHAWLGGLLEHTVEMLKVAEAVAVAFPKLDRDLLIAGVVLHDLGKLYELGLEADIEYTVPGNLEGHMVQGVQILDRALSENSAEEEIQTLLRHLVLSHQGQLDYAAVVEPMIPEAIALHYIDQLSSQVRPAIEDIHDAKKKGVRGAFIRGQTAMRSLYVRSE
jgi:3'-5' exoribonuclease